MNLLGKLLSLMLKDASTENEFSFNLFVLTMCLKQSKHCAVESTWVSRQTVPKQLRVFPNHGSTV